MVMEKTIKRGSIDHGKRHEVLSPLSKRHSSAVDGSVAKPPKSPQKKRIYEAAYRNS